MCDEKEISDRMVKIRELIMPVIWDAWCINEVSWSEIFDYLKNHFTNDVLSDLSMIIEEDIDKHTLITKDK